MRWTTKSSRYLLRRWWMNLRQDHVVLPDGTELPEFHVVEYPDWACVVCRDQEGYYLMVEQYRYGIDRVSLEFPAGAVDPGETPIEAARREVLEETGFGLRTLRKLGSYAPEPAKHSNWAHLYAAELDEQLQAPNPGPSEQLRVVRLSPDELALAVSSGRMVHGVHVAAYHASRQEGE